MSVCGILKNRFAEIVKMGMLEFLRRCRKCGHTEIVVHGSDHGPILVQGSQRCNETDWQIMVTLRAEAGNRRLDAERLAGLHLER
jgi:hypothetical protein